MTSINEQLSPDEIKAKLEQAWSRIPGDKRCMHVNRNTAKNVNVYINKDGYLSSNPASAMFHKSVTYCKDCDKVLEVV